MTEKINKSQLDFLSQVEFAYPPIETTNWHKGNLASTLTR